MKVLHSHLRLVITLGLVLMGNCWAFGQSSLPAVWMQFFTQHRSEKGLFLEADAGYRGDELGTKATTVLARVGIGRDFFAGYATAGAAWFETIATNPNSLDRAEFRIYQKLQLRQAFRQLDINHIYLIEERWMQRADHSGFDFRMRFRYQMQLVFAAKSKKLLGATPYVTTNAEIFLANDRRVFSQLRLYGGVGLNWNKRWKLELGYLQQWQARARLGLSQDQIVRTSVTYCW